MMSPRQLNRINEGMAAFGLPYFCRACGEVQKRHAAQTPEEQEARGNVLCLGCYTAAGIENEHSDGLHDDHPSPVCISCFACDAQVRKATKC